jgi:hypothetical protein
VDGVSQTTVDWSVESAWGSTVRTRGGRAAAGSTTTEAAWPGRTSGPSRAGT